MLNSIRTIWLADDDDDDRMLLREALVEVAPDLELVVFRDGHEIIDHLCGADVLPDLVILDINMPKKTGFDCLSEIKSNPKLSSLAAVIWSTGLTESRREQAFKLGARLAVQKPNSFTHLREIAKRISTANLSESVMFDNDFRVE